MPPPLRSISVPILAISGDHQHDGRRALQPRPSWRGQVLAVPQQPTSRRVVFARGAEGRRSPGHLHSATHGTRGWAAPGCSSYACGTRPELGERFGMEREGQQKQSACCPGVWSLEAAAVLSARLPATYPRAAGGSAPGAPRAVAQRSVFGEHGDHWHFACVWALVRHCLGAVRGRIDAPRYLSSPDSTFSLASCCLGALPCVQFEGHHTAAHADRCGCYPPGSRGCCRPCWQLCAAHLHVGQGMLCPRAKRGISLKSVEDAC